MGGARNVHAGAARGRGPVGQCSFWPRHESASKKRRVGIGSSYSKSGSERCAATRQGRKNSDMTAIEIAVPAAAQKRVQRALGRNLRVRLVPPQEARTAKIFVSTLSALPAPHELDKILFESVPVIVLVGRTSMAAPVLLQRLTRLVRQLPAGVEPFLPPNAQALRRLVLAAARGAEKQLIATASLENDELVVWSCEPREFRCRISDIPALKDVPRSRLKRFSISSSGSRLRWPDEGIDLSLDTFRELSDPEYREANEKRFRREAKRFADAIRTLRKGKGLKQDQIAGLSERQVRRLESGEVYPHSSTLNKLAAAHDLSPAEYVRQLSVMASNAA